MQFELPYWEGEHPAVQPEDNQEDYPLPFHPLELGEAALAEFFGYQLEGDVNQNYLDPKDIRLMCFKRSRWWKLW